MNNKHKLKKNRERYATALFFEDIRQEATGQLIFIGVYPDNNLHIPAESLSTGVTLVKLSIAVTVRLLPTDMTEAFSILVKFPAGEHQRIEHMLPPSPASDEEVGEKSFMMLVSLQMIALKSPGLISVHVETQNELLFAGALRVLASPDLNQRQ